jgi:hypothetical protein
MALPWARMGTKVVACAGCCAIFAVLGCGHPSVSADGAAASDGAAPSDGADSQRQETGPDAPASEGGGADAPVSEGGGADTPVSEGGGDAPPSDRGTTPRLVPWQIEADGTAPLVMGIYDSQENVHCRFLPDQAGQLRCLPWGLAALTDTKAFSDSSCQKRIYETDPDEGKVLVGRSTALPLPRLACAPQRYAVGKLVVSPAGARFGGTPCAALPDQQSTHLQLTVDSAEASDRWATGTELDGPLLAGRMRVRRIRDEEGEVFDDHFIDEHWSKPCHLVASASDVLCEPATTQTSSFHYVEGDNCSGRPVWRATACQDPSFIGSAGGSAYALGPVWTGSVTYEVHGCQHAEGSSTPEGPDVFFELGAQLGADAIMTAKPWRLGGTGRLQLRGLAADDGSLVPVPDWLLFGLSSVLPSSDTSRYFDTVAQTSCNPIRAPDGILRCLPTSFVVNPTPIAFSDAACTQPAFYCPTGMNPCPGLVAAPAVVEATGELRAVSLNATVSVATPYWLANGCVAQPALAPIVFGLGAAQSWSPYATLTERNARAPDAP